MGFQFVKTAKVRGVMPFYKQKGKTSKLLKEVFESNTIAAGVVLVYPLLVRFTCIQMLCVLYTMHAQAHGAISLF